VKQCNSEAFATNGDQNTAIATFRCKALLGRNLKPILYRRLLGLRNDLQLGRKLSSAVRKLLEAASEYLRLASHRSRAG